MHKQNVKTYKNANGEATMILWHKYYTGRREEYEIEVLYSDAPTYKVLTTKNKEEAEAMYREMDKFYEDIYS